MLTFLTVVRGSTEALREKPLAVFACCPTSPLSWSDLTCLGIPAVIQVHTIDMGSDTELEAHAKAVLYSQLPASLEGHPGCWIFPG